MTTARLRGELLRFLLVGGSAVAIDGAAYSALLLLGLPPAPAKAAGFLLGTVFAFFANRSFVFKADSSSPVLFLLLYAATLAANVGMNEVILRVAERLGGGLLSPSLSKGAAFVVATGVSAALNFIGMKMFVFKPAAVGNPVPSSRRGPGTEWESGVGSGAVSRAESGMESTSKPESAPDGGARDRRDGMRFSLVVPCYNEARSLEELSARCAVLVQAGAEVILIDNGSTDETQARLAALGVPQVSADLPFAALKSLRVEENQGYGFGILSGLRVARGDVLGWTHADLQTDPQDALRGFEIFSASAAPELLFVKGCRHGRPPADVFFTAGMSLFETLLFRRPMNDVNAQPTLLHRSFFERWSSPPPDFSLDLYAYAKAAASNLAVERFPVHFGARVHGVSHWNLDWRSKLKFIKRTFSYSIRLSGSPDLRSGGRRG